ncbi:MAG: PilN domain-containing protein [Propionivibrio sp.]
MSQQINLYEERLRPRLELATGRNLGISALVFLAIMVGWSLWAGAEADRRSAAAEALLRELSAAQEKMKALTQSLAQRTVSAELAAEVESAKAKIAAREEVIKALDAGALGRTAGFSSFMRGFAQQAQSDLWLTGFRIAAGGDEIEIRGRMLDPVRLPDYVQRLNAIPVFQGRRFAALEMQRVSLDETSPVPTAEAVAGQRVSGGDSARPFVEFRLRSDTVGGADAASRAKGAS